MAKLTKPQIDMLMRADRYLDGNPWPSFGMKERSGKAQLFRRMQVAGYFDFGNCITKKGRAALMTAQQPTPTAGQIWKENDPRQERMVQIMRANDNILYVRTRFDDGMLAKREIRAKASRFNGKRGGYSFVRNAEGA